MQTLKEQLTNKDEHIKDLTQLLDQSQRLQLDVQNKLNKLESNTIQIRENDSKGDKSNSDIHTNKQNEKPSNETRESFWKRLFR